MKRILASLLIIGLLFIANPSVELNAATSYRTVENFKGVKGDTFKKYYNDGVPISATVTAKDGTVVYRYAYYPSGPIKQKNTYTRAGLISKKSYWTRYQTIDRIKSYDKVGRIYKQYYYNNRQMTTSYEYRPDGTRKYRRDYVVYNSHREMTDKYFYDYNSKLYMIRQYSAGKRILSANFDQNLRVVEMWVDELHGPNTAVAIKLTDPIKIYYYRDNQLEKRQTGYGADATCYTYATGEMFDDACDPSVDEDYSYFKDLIKELEIAARP